MTWVVNKLELNNLQHCLARSFNEFKAQHGSRDIIFKRYRSALMSKNFKSYYAEYGADSEVCASFFLNSTFVSHKNTKIKVAFLTQVIVSPSFRGQGFSYEINKMADHLAIEEGASATIVIARKAARDLYFKLGYVGFSHFPSVELSKQDVIEKPLDLIVRKANSGDSVRIKQLFDSTYRELPFHFVRNEETIKSLIVDEQLQIFIEFSGRYYFVANQSKLVEVGFSAGLDLREIRDTLSRYQSISSVNLHSKHAFHKYLVNQGAKNLERFELREGHLIKFHANLESVFQGEFSALIKHPGQEYFEVPYFDQW